MSQLRRYFLAGLLIILPAFITIYFLYAIFRFIDSIWGKLINVYLRNNFGFTVPGLGIILGIITVLVVGFVATNLFGKRVFQIVESWFLKLPLISQIYYPAKEIVNSFFSKEKKAFKEVVLVEYPCKGIWSIGFLTNDGFKEAEEPIGEELLHVFIATTPSPFTGFLILVPRRDVKFLNITIEQGIKLIVSGGILKP